MIKDPLVLKWHNAILAEVEAKLGRPLREYEREFIVSRQGVIALELIHDTVKASTAAGLEKYLSS